MSKKEKKNNAKVIVPKQNSEIDKTEIKKVSIRKGSKIVANGRCFGASSLECPLKTVRDYATKVLNIDKEHNSVLIDEGWISKENIK